jgi:hypothetical protein
MQITTVLTRSVAALLLAGLSLAAQSLDPRAVIDRTQQDINRSMEFERHKGREIVRYDNAQHHLSDFDRELTRGRFDKGKLNQAITDVKNLVDHNTLDPDLRDALTADLRDLRVMRAEHER